MCWAASARHPGQSSPSTMSYSFPVSLPAPPPPFPPRCCRPPLGLQSPVLARRCPLGPGCHRPLQSPAEALGEGTALRPSFCFPTGRHFSPWLEGTEVLTRGGTVQAWCWGPGWGAGLVPSPSLASSARGGLPPPPGKLSAGEPSRGSSQSCRLPGKMCSSPSMFPPASLFLSTHLFSFSSRLYFKDDVRPSTSLPSPPLPSPPGR